MQPFLQGGREAEHFVNVVPDRLDGAASISSSSPEVALIAAADARRAHKAARVQSWRRGGLSEGWKRYKVHLKIVRSSARPFDPRGAPGPLLVRTIRNIQQTCRGVAALPLQRTGAILSTNMITKWSAALMNAHTWSAPGPSGLCSVVPMSL